MFLTRRLLSEVMLQLEPGGSEMTVMAESRSQTSRERT